MIPDTVAIMRKMIAFILMALTAAVPLLAKSKGPVGDWQAVQQDVPRGWGLEVVTSMTFPCVFDHATADELICRPIERGGRESDDAEIHVRRDRIREIRVEKREGANMLAGGGAGAGLAAILGAVLIPGGAGRAAFAFGLGGASIGARHGRDIHILHGKVIYRRAAPDQSAASIQAESPDAGKNSRKDTKDVKQATADTPIVRTSL